MKKTKKVKKQHPIRVNLGCGSNIVEGFINIDDYVGADNPNFLRGNALDIPLEKNSVDYILLDQVLEHIAMADIVPVLHEIRRVLKIGGQAVIIVPDFEDAVNSWLQHCRTYFEPLRYQYFSEVIYGNQMHEGEFHKTPISPQYLNYALNTAGLVNHTVTMHVKDGPIPNHPGTRPFPPEARCRNAQLVAVIKKTK